MATNLNKAMADSWANASDEVKGRSSPTRAEAGPRRSGLPLKEELSMVRKAFVAQDFEAAAERCEAYLLGLRPDLRPSETDLARPEKEGQAAAAALVRGKGGAGGGAGGGGGGGGEAPERQTGRRLAHWARSPRPSVSLTLASSSADTSFCAILLQCAYELGRRRTSKLELEGRVGLVERFYAAPVDASVAGGGAGTARATLPFDVAAVWLRLRLHGRGVKTKSSGGGGISSSSSSSNNKNHDDDDDDRLGIARDAFARWFQGSEGRIFLDERLRVNEIGRRDVLLATINRRSAVPLTPASLRLRFRWALTLLLLDVLVPLGREEEATKLLVRCTSAGKTSPLLTEAEAEEIMTRIRVGMRARRGGRSVGRAADEEEEAKEGEEEKNDEEEEREEAEEEEGEKETEQEKEKEDVMNKGKGRKEEAVLGPSEAITARGSEQGIIVKVQARITKLVAAARR